MAEGSTGGTAAKHKRLNGAFSPLIPSAGYGIVLLEYMRMATQIFHAALWMYIVMLFAGCTSKKVGGDSAAELLSNAWREKHDSCGLPYPISDLKSGDPEFSWWMLRDDEKSLRRIASIIPRYTLRDLSVCMVDNSKKAWRFFRMKPGKEEIKELNSLLRTIQSNPGTDFRFVSASDFGEYGPVYFEMYSEKHGKLVIPLNAITADTERPHEKYPFYTRYAGRIRRIVKEVCEAARHQAS